jgi:hypothetical protein
MTRAAMMPIFHGQRLMLRSALKVVFSKEFSRSPIARFPLWALLLVIGLLLLGELAALRFLERDGDGGAHSTTIRPLLPQIS